MSPARFVAIHGHFYQPPRENPWLEAVEVQDSAHPFHDWNARVTAECYAPNTAARRVDEANRIIDIVDNFEQISFDAGPTLLAWLARERPDVLDAMVDADRRSRAARDGHGNAIAQAYNHVILPLASRRDKVTQVRWGLADFRARFGRDAEGMWLPETAVDRETLEVLAEEGVGFTILAPRQAASAREGGQTAWRPVGAAIDPARAYRYDAGGGRSLALFFYDAAIAQAVAFEGLLRSGDDLAARLLGAFDDRRPFAQLVHIATDGESYGHHHRFGEMALAVACDRIDRSGEAALTSYGAFLAAYPPEAEVRVVGASSWSCAHGVERWRADCGCRAGHPGGHQRWRAPLREALDWLRDEVDPLFEARAGALLKDPWAARDDYIEVILDRSPERLAAFLDRHRLRPLGAPERVQAVKCLELQRQRLLMFTSCGWFFDEISGVESVQCLRHAARVVQLAGELGGDSTLEAGLLDRLRAAPSNVPDLGTGDVVYRRHALPAVADLRRVVAHYAIAAPHEAYGDVARVYAFTVERLDWQREAYGDTSLAIGRVRVTSEVTTEADLAAVAVLHFGGHDFHCAIRDPLPPEAYASLRKALFGCFAGRSLSEVVRALDEWWDGRGYGIRDLFLEERRRVLALVTESVLARLEETYRRLYEDNRRLMQYLRESDAPVPDALALAARHVLQRDADRELGVLGAGGPTGPGAARVREIVLEAQALGIDLALAPERITRCLERALIRGVAGLAVEEAPDGAAGALAVLELGRELGAGLDLWAAQTRFFPIWRGATARARARLAPLARALGFRVQP